jgi:hypothetical protein
MTMNKKFGISAEARAAVYAAAGLNADGTQQRDADNRPIAPKLVKILVYGAVTPNSCISTRVEEYRNMKNPDRVVETTYDTAIQRIEQGVAELADQNAEAVPAHRR